MFIIGNAWSLYCNVINNSSPQKADIFYQWNSFRTCCHYTENCRQVLIDIFVNICRLSKQLDDLANADSSLFSDEQKVC